ncbi:aldehyde dehydrogenase family protein [Nitrincola nitratireducens]|uniref:Phenylacetaldehyde dehydrogenase n=1 Tax=Nitrincola nitratireducens TaxID=1229521 RepID=W9UZA5_9GAMM|nr:aldehyde dehydrogenase family protein [Nitrincola nitratireducens]EXJ12573.1 Phenylacetaldehyde dehydrogenase [Nitrincola nitratireducens]
MINIKTMLIDGMPLIGTGEPFSVINPATEDIICQCNMASTEQLDQAVAAAKRAYSTWRQTPDAERKRLLHEIADHLEQHADELASIIVQEQGKPLALAQIEVGAAVGWTRYTAELDIPEQVFENSDTRYTTAHRKPLGVVASITPWNWPLMIAIWHIMPALRAGNTVVSKPSGLTPLNTLRLVQIINEVLPKGVVNVVLGEADIGNAISRHIDINKVIFTGSTPTGQRILSNSANTLKRLTLELGGNDAAIVLPDTDINQVAESIFNTAFLNMGQTCAAIKRLYVHESQYEEMGKALADLASQQVVGNGLNPATTFGPVQNARQYRLVSELVEDARRNGGHIICGGEASSEPGYFYPPTIVSNVSKGVRLVDEEQFGPVLPLISYLEIDDAVRMANSCEYGLGGSVWGSDLELAETVARQLECGTVWINKHAEVLPHIPFGGCKLSGVGVEFGVEGLLEYTQLQVINRHK